ncbi:hypothetical protein [Halomonas daqiaonensis]|uniref:Uncharacterized protein n=1 Tax=Halomonas daqiaonensis TaxID=650850 RepID=A0A1H7TIC9_9GAMM|nr:hypothetical protein [Halomonas daqiaonensis]SEL84096.1 hypothetical protein SAMN04488129_11752 [Halomonas daqiaonensis]
MQTSQDTFRTYRRVMQVGIALNVLIGLWLWWWPASLLEIIRADLAAPLTWPRYAGLAMLAMGLLYLPAALSPLHNRLVALLSILFRGLFALFFLFASGLLWLPALYEAVLAVLQGITFWRGWRADLMAKP